MASAFSTTEGETFQTPWGSGIGIEEEEKEQVTDPTTG